MKHKNYGITELAPLAFYITGEGPDCTVAGDSLLAVVFFEKREEGHQVFIFMPNRKRRCFLTTDYPYEFDFPNRSTALFYYKRAVEMERAVEGMVERHAMDVPSPPSPPDDDNSYFTKWDEKAGMWKHEDITGREDEEQYQ